jgi:hypothetical protein
MIKSRRMVWAGHVALMGETRNAYRILVGKPEGKTPLGRPRLRWVDNIVAYLLRARTVEPEKRPLLVNNSETTFVSRQQPQNKQQNNVHC